MEIAILDFGGQYVQNIKRIMLEKGVKSVIVDYRISASEIVEKGVKGIILSGGPYSIYDDNPPFCDPKILSLGIPVLGLCYGHQLIAYLFGGSVKKGKRGEYGFSELRLDEKNVLFHGLQSKEICWMSHGDVVSKLPNDFEILASTPESEIAASTYQNRIYSLQFHPEVFHTPKGHIILENFAFNICKCSKRKWIIEHFIEDIIQQIQKTLDNERAVIAVSGGVDSSTAALLAMKAIRKNLLAVHIDHGLMRKGESRYVVSMMKKMKFNIVHINASPQFYLGLEKISNPDQKRLIIGRFFVEEFEKIAEKFNASWLIQGTIAPDVIESTRGEYKTKNQEHGGIIKIHHNVAGLPSGMKLKLLEPLSSLFKYQVRILAKKLGLPKEMIYRQPFPGPGLACRITGPVTKEKITLLRNINIQVETELERYKPSQYFAILINNTISYKSTKGSTIATKYLKQNVEAYVLKDKSIGVKGDHRVVGRIMVIKIDKFEVWETTSWIDILKMQNEITGSLPDICRVVAVLSTKKDGKYGIIARAVDTLDYMTAMPTQIDFNRLTKLGKNLIDKYQNLGLFGFELTTKPASTIELF